MIKHKGGVCRTTFDTPPFLSISENHYLYITIRKEYGRTLYSHPLLRQALPVL